MAANRVLQPGDPGYDPNQGDPWADTPFAKQPEYGLPGGDGGQPKSTTQSQGQQQPDQPEEPHGTAPPPPPATTPPPAATPGAATNPTDPYAPSNQQQGHLTGDQQAQAMLARLNAPGQQANASSIVDEFNNAYGPTSKYYNDDRGETIGFPTGYLAKTPSGWTWTQRGPEGAGGSASTTPKPVDTSGLDGILQQMLQQQQQQQAARQAYNDKIHGSVLDTINKNSQPVDANDPIITSQMAAYRGEQGRNTQLMRETLAERNAATGGTSGALESGIKSTVEDAGNKSASAEASAMVNELTQRRGALQAALQTGAGVLSADEQNNLQSTIAQINGQLGKLGIQAGQSNTAATLALQSLLGNKSLDQQNNQFYDDFGAKQANQSSQLDQLLLQYLLSHGSGG